MKNLLRNLFCRLIEVAGGRPEVVVPLVAGLEKAAFGQSEILRQQRRGRLVFSAATVRLIVLVLSALGSIGLAMFMLMRPGEMHPPVGVLVLVVTQYVVVLSLVLVEAAPELLAQEDEQILGWWPITGRELILARLSLLLRPALEVTLALATLPLLVLAFTGQPPLLTALVFGVGLLVQAIGVTFGVAVFLLLIVRLFGRRTAVRLGAMLSGGNHFFLVYPLLFGGEKLVPWFGAHRWLLYLFPPVWFAGWGDLAAGQHYWLRALAGLVSAILVVWLGTRLAVSRRQHPGVVVAHTRPRRFALGGAVSFLLRPMMGGTEGWAVRKLLEAHLREDWRFVSALLAVPFVLLLFGFNMMPAHAVSSGGPDVQYTALTSVHMVTMLFVLGPLMLQTSQQSSTPKALWLLALADLKTTRILAAQRGMVRGLILLPSLLIYAVAALKLGASWLVVVRDTAILWLELDAVTLIVQPWLGRMPFSVAFKREDTANRILLGFLVMGVALVFWAVLAVYAAFNWARPTLWVLLPLVWLWFRLRVDRVMKDRRLDMEFLTR